MRRINYDALARATDDGPQPGKPSPKDHVKVEPREPVTAKFTHRVVFARPGFSRPVKPANSGRKRKA